MGMELVDYNTSMQTPPRRAWGWYALLAAAIVVFMGAIVFAVWFVRGRMERGAAVQTGTATPGFTVTSPREPTTEEVAQYNIPPGTKVQTVTDGVTSTVFLLSSETDPDSVLPPVPTVSRPRAP